jgi:hypothetical protein
MFLQVRKNLRVLSPVLACAPESVRPRRDQVGSDAAFIEVVPGCSMEQGIPAVEG